MTDRIEPLTDQQFDRVWRDKSNTTEIGKVLAAMAIKLGEQLAVDDQLFWESVARLAKADHQVCTIDWVNRCIRVKEPC